MRSTVALLAVALAACSPKPAPAPVESPPVAAPAPPADAVSAAPEPATLPCPDEATVAARLAAVLSPAENQRLTAVRCTPGQFGVPGWLITAYRDELADGDPPDLPSSSEVVRVILDGERIIASAEPELLAPWLRGELGGIGGMRPADLDGDGVDELINEDGASHGGSSTEYVIVWRIEGDKLHGIFNREIGYDNLTGESDEPIEWTSSVEVAPSPSGVGHQLVVTTTWAQGKPGPEDLGPGQHVFRLIDGKIVEVAPGG